MLNKAVPDNVNEYNLTHYSVRVTPPPGQGKAYWTHFREKKSAAEAACRPQKQEPEGTTRELYVRQVFFMQMQKAR